MLRAHAPQRQVVIAIDANIDFVKHSSGEKKYIAEPMARKMMEESHVTIPGLDEGILHAAMNPTFEKAGAEVAIDHIIVSNQIRYVQGSAVALLDFDTNGFRDHVPTCIEVIVDASDKTPAKKRRVVQYDRREAQKAVPEKVQTMNALLQVMPVVPEWVDTTAHQHNIDEWVQAALGTVYPKQPKPPKAEHISDETARLLNARGRVLGKARFLGRLASKQALRMVFRYWCSAKKMSRKRIKGKTAPDVAISPVYGLKSKEECVNIALLHLVAADIAEEADGMVKQDEAAAAEAANANLVNAINGHDVTAMYSMSKWIITEHKKRTALCINDLEGNAVYGHVAVKRRWRQHFQDLMDGEEVKLQKVIEDHRCRIACRQDQAFDVRNIPTNLERATKMKRYKITWVSAKVGSAPSCSSSTAGASPRRWPP